MCQCTPNIRTPFCGKGECSCPNEKKEGVRTANPIDQYNAWRITFQDAERAAQSAYAEMLRYRGALEDIQSGCETMIDLANKTAILTKPRDYSDDFAWCVAENALRSAALDELTRIAQENGEYD